jgi:hypothetical protein
MVGTAGLALTATIVLVVALILIGLAGAGLGGQGPFGALSGATPYATTPRQPTFTPLPAQHVQIDENLTTAQSGWEKDSNCVFKSDGYHVIAPPLPPNLTAKVATAGCVAPGTYANFDLTAHVHAPGGAKSVEYLLIFRYSDSGHYDFLDVDLDLPSNGEATWTIQSEINNVGNEILGETTGATHSSNADNTLEIYADGPDFTAFINGELIGSYRDTINDQPGQIALGVVSGEDIYTSVKVATLG